QVGGAGRVDGDRRALQTEGVDWLPQVPALADSPWPRRLPVDLAVSSAIAATITTWRWRGSRAARTAQHRLPTAPRPERQTS
ncbi:hypothetical protein ABZW03_38265, partial [Kitasatospora sp. NPDC004799]